MGPGVKHARPTIDEIARRAGVSKATVDRVLNDRPGVQEHTRAHVLAIASIAPRQGEGARIQLDFVLPGGANAFMDDLERQLERQMQARDDVVVVVHRLKGFSPEEIAARLEALQATTRGVGVIGVDSPRVREAVRRLIGAGVPVLTLVSDISHAGRFSYVGIDNRAAGRLAGYLIGRFIPGAAGKVALIAGSLAYRGHEEREMGFRHVLQESFPALDIVAQREIGEDAGRAYDEVSALLAEHADLRAIYCIGSGVEGVARALREFHREQTIFIGHDLTDDTRQFLLSGVMDAAIDQNSRVEAREAIDRLARAARGEAAVSSATIRIQAVFRENMPADI